MKLDVGGRRSTEMENRRGPAEDLFHRRVEQCGVVQQPPPLLGVLEEGEEALGEGGAGGFVAGHDEEQEEPLELVLREPVPAELTEEGAENVVRVEAFPICGDGRPAAEQLGGV